MATHEDLGDSSRFVNLLQLLQETCPPTAPPQDTQVPGSLWYLENHFGKEPVLNRSLSYMKKYAENTKLVLVSLMSTYPSQGIRSLFLNLSRLFCLLPNKLKLQVAHILLCWWFPTSNAVHAITLLCTLVRTGELQQARHHHVISLTSSLTAILETSHWKPTAQAASFQRPWANTSPTLVPEFASWQADTHQVSPCSPHSRCTAYQLMEIG